MNLNLMIFLTATVALVTYTIRVIATSSHKRPEPTDPGRLPQLEESMARIERRLSNLETIVTGKDYHLRHEFENLERSEMGARS